jgi:glycerol-3-phosphate O-acyltransferase
VRAEDKERVLVEVVQRTLDHWCKNAAMTEEALFETIYQERQRLERESNKKKVRREGSFYDRIYHEALKGSAGQHRELLKEVIHFFATEVVGHFDPRVYALATRVIPTGLSLLLNTVSPLRLVETLQGSNSLMDQLEITGEVEAAKRVADLGTTVLVPTHSSNLDSILVGFGLYRMGLPPYTYGAGLNLFTNKLIGFFMHNLGAYTVDRRKKAAVYKDVLKTYAGYSMELGYDNLFFPGGTRSRSGAVENKLKMGLLGMGLDAYVHNLLAKKEKPDIFVIPCTINYQLVLEAETLIDDHLKEVGKSRYIIEDDEFSKPKRIFEFVKQLFSLHSTIHLVVSKPLDMFGNEVDENGVSRDHRGRPVDRSRYVLDASGKPSFSQQRDKEYTRELGRSIVDAFHRDTVLKSTNLVARAVFDLLRDSGPSMDLYRLLRTGGPEESFGLPEAYRRVEETLDTVRSMEQQGKLKLDDTLKNKDTVAVVSEALAHLGSYHRKPALRRQGDRLFHDDRNLLLYYQNRLEGLVEHSGKAGS